LARPQSGASLQHFRRACGREIHVRRGAAAMQRRMKSGILPAARFEAYRSMSDLPRRVDIHEEGPREGFQIEAGPIATADKVRFIEALAETGLNEVQCVSFVDPRRVPAMADAEAVAAAIRRRAGVRYTGIWLNVRGLERAIKTTLDISGGLQISASETFSIRNTNKNTAETLAEQRRSLAFYREQNIAVRSAIVMTAFGCNFEGAISPERVCDCIAMLVELAAEDGVTIELVRLADTVG
jgi:hydroxymethylglutaryl-CoA lyase